MIVCVYIYKKNSLLNFAPKMVESSTIARSRSLVSILLSNHQTIYLSISPLYILHSRVDHDDDQQERVFSLILTRSHTKKIAKKKKEKSLKISD